MYLEAAPMSQAMLNHSNNLMSTKCQFISICASLSDLPWLALLLSPTSIHCFLIKRRIAI
jgi:hypothetical protein